MIPIGVIAIKPNFMSTYKKKPPALKIPTAKTVAVREQLRIGRQVKQALDQLIPATNRMTDAEIAKQLGISQQRVTQIELIACYKLRMKLLELFRNEEMVVNGFDKPKPQSPVPLHTPGYDGI